jgi:hypothetical protein
MGHFFPWTIFAIYLFRKGAIKEIWNEPFLKFCILTFLCNITVYWVSPTTFARYLFMFLPLVFAPLIFLHLKEEAFNFQPYKIINALFITMISIVAIGSVLGPVLNVTRTVPLAVVKGCLLFLSTMFILYIYIKNKKERLEYMIILLLITRIGFDWLLSHRDTANHYNLLLKKN